VQFGVEQPNGDKEGVAYWFTYGEDMASESWNSEIRSSPGKYCWTSIRADRRLMYWKELPKFRRHSFHRV